MQLARLLGGRARGQVMVLFALLIFVFAGVLALALDTGYLIGQRRHAQSTADAAALATARHWMTGADACS